MLLAAACGPLITPLATATPVTPTPQPFPTSNYAAIPQVTLAAEVAIGQVLDDVAFPSGDIQLVGRLELPEGTGPFPAVIWVHGSGMSTRDEANPLLETLVHNGYAVFSYDKRGVGDSGGSYSGMSAGNSLRILPQLAGDAAAAVDYLAGLAEIDSSRIGLFGASQAGWIIPQAAALSQHVAFMALISGPAVPVGMEGVYSQMTRDQGGSITEAQAAEYSARLRDYPLDFSGYDPRADIAALRVPGLWMLGAQDASQPTRETVAVLEELRVENEHITIFVFPNGNHGLIGVPFMQEVLLPWLAGVAQP